VCIEPSPQMGGIQTGGGERRRDGHVLEHMGERKSLDAESVHRKFRDVVKGVISDERAESIQRAIAALDSQQDVRAIGALLSAE
jgi:hypothetical protein